jgi:hypothetical protein
MRKTLAGLDPVRDRLSPRKARQLFELLWPNRAIRAACADRLAQSIRHAHQQANAGWVVTLHNWGVRLDVGQVLVLQLDSDEIFVYAHSSRGKSEYNAVRVPSRTFQSSPAKIAAIPAKNWRDHERFIGAAAKAKKGSPWSNSFSEGVLKYLETLLRTELPRPAYLTKSIRKFHILQGGIQNGDKKWLERAGEKGLRSPSWIAPKSANVGDEAVIYITGYGFFATAIIDSEPKRRTNWARRYGAALNRIELIQPPISLGALRTSIPKLNWANYPRSITTLTAELATQVRRLIERRRNDGLPSLDDSALASANLGELRKLALLSARSTAPRGIRVGSFRQRSRRIHYYVLRRAQGHCEGCNLSAPFQKLSGEPYLEPHHTRRLADDGPDHPATVIALCPNCHRRAHFANDTKKFNQSLVRKLRRIEPKRP